MEKRQYPQLGEEVHWEVLPNGLTVAVVPRPGFQKKVAYFATNFGSVDTSFTLDGEQVQVPDGIAHYLEHKLFDMPDRDVTAEFAALGAYPNAFTSFTMTAYHFSCTEHFDDCLKLLLEFVSTPYFTEESVQKEQGIIGQEIGIYKDSPESRVFEDLMRITYENHPIREPILGTEESISKITPDLLYKCHRAFYRPSNMLLCVVGDVDAQTVCRIADEVLPKMQEPQVYASRSWEESMIPKKQETRRAMEVAMPMFQLGFKCEPIGLGQEMMRKEIVGDLAAEALFGESSDLYLQMYEQGIIDSSFAGGFDSLDDMAGLTAGGDSETPEKVRSAILDAAAHLAQKGIPEQDFIRMKRSAMGRRIRSLDRFDSLCFRICAYYFANADYFRFPEAYQQVKREEIREFLSRVATKERLCLSVVEPLRKEETKC